MTDENRPFHRRSIRLKEYDYSSPGAYYVTICVNKREIFFDRDDIKEQINIVWRKIPDNFKNVFIDAFVIMPNHIHGILFINDNTPDRNCQTTLGTIIQWFKTMTTNAYIKGVREKDWKPFNQRFWQRNYYEHIIRNEKELDKIRKYIENNPLGWETDEDNPNHI